jgi:hypothetical protein
MCKHRYVPTADTPTAAVRVPPWLVAGGEAAPPPRQVTITAEVSSSSSIHQLAPILLLASPES